MNRFFKCTSLAAVLAVLVVWPGLLPAQLSQPEAVKPASSPVADTYYHFMQARLYDGAGDFAGALGEFELALKSDPDNAQILTEYASTLADIGRTDDALAMAQKATEKDSRNIDAHLLMGDIYFRIRMRQDPKARDLAIREYEAALALDPDSASALGSLGRLYVAANQYSDAEPLLQKLVDRQPDAIEEQFLLAVSQTELRKYEPALENARRVLQVNPANTRVLSLQGFIYERLQNVDAAVATYQEILRLQPQDAEAKRRLAALLAGKGEAKDATRMLEELAKRNPFDSSVLLELGKAQREQKKYIEAIASFRSAAKTDADNPEISFWLASTLAETGERDEAISVLKKLLERRTEDPSQQRSRFPVLTQIGMIQQDAAQQDAAIATFERVVREFPEDFRSYLYLANAYRMKKDWNRAGETLTKAREKFPQERSLAVTQAQVVAQQRGLETGLQLLDKQLQAYLNARGDQERAILLQLRLNRAQLLADHKALQRAESELLQLNSEFPENEVVLFQLAAVYERQKKISDAERVFKRLLQKDAENAGVLNYLGYMWAERGENLQQALEYIQKAVDLEPFNGAYLDSLGWAQFKLNDLKAAESNLSKAAKIVRNDATIHEHLGDIYEKLGNYGEALQAYRQSLSFASEDDDTNKLKEKIRRLDKRTKK